jgi:hypothetical protein
VAIQFRSFLCLQYVVGFVETHSTCRGHFESFFSAAAGKPFAPAWTGKLVLSKERLPLRWAYPETRGNRNLAASAALKIKSMPAKDLAFAENDPCQ